MRKNLTHIALCSVLIMALASCGDSDFKNSIGRYYSYTNFVKNSNSWIELQKGGKWTDDAGAKGTYKLDGDRIGFFINSLMLMYYYLMEH